MSTKKRTTKTSIKVENDVEIVPDTKPINNLVELPEQKVMFVPDHLCQDSFSYKTVKFSHPRTNTPVLFLNTDDKLFEITSHTTTDKYASFLIDETISSSGNIYCLTPFDPKYLALPKIREKKAFMELDELVGTELSSLFENSNMELIADVKEIVGKRLYLFNEEKTIAWLGAKVEKVCDILMSRGIFCEAVARSKVIKEEKSDIKREDFLCSALGIVREYISDDLAALVEQKLGIEPRKPKASDTSMDSNKDKESDKPKRRKTEEPIEDYSNKLKTSQKPNVPTKMTPAQKRLEKCDKSGMKNIMSFFGKK